MSYIPVIYSPYLYATNSSVGLLFKHQLSFSWGYFQFPLLYELQGRIHITCLQLLKHHCIPSNVKIDFFFFFGSPWILFPSSSAENPQLRRQGCLCSSSWKADSPTGSRSSKPPGQEGWPAVSAGSSHGRSGVWSVPPWSTPHWETGQGTGWGKECICNGFNTMCYKLHIPQHPKEQLLQLFATSSSTFWGLLLGTTKSSLHKKKKIEALHGQSSRRGQSPNSSSNHLLLKQFSVPNY